MKYNHRTIEQKWQQRWQEEQQFRVADAVEGRDNYYLLVEFPYPSGNLHIGHWYAFCVPDIFARFQRMRGRNVLFPIGFDAFGLPAENAALKHGVNPREWTYDNIARMRQQLKSMGASFDWSREVVTCDPQYYRWTQWLFLQFFKAGLAYQAETAVNWCPSCKTVLANEQVIQGACERCDSAVEQRQMKQWLLCIKDYAERLVDGLHGLDWPEEIKLAQRNWIGRSEGAIIKFPISNFQFPIKSQVQNSNLCVEVFTTRADTIFGATYLVLAPEHPFIENCKLQIINYKQVKQYVEQSKRKTELERGALQKEKTGVELKGIKAVNPATDEEIPVWVADYVLMGYGTGAIMAVPGHDSRDFAFAKKFKLTIRTVITPGVSKSQFPISQQAPSSKLQTNEAYEGEGMLVNSGQFNGMNSEQARRAITQWLERHGKGHKQVTYRLRDWLISRQRYWGCPIPIIYCRRCWENPKSKIQNPKLVGSKIDGVMHAVIPVPEDQLPVELPELEDYKPRDDGRSPLAKATGWVRTTCPQCGGKAERETDTLDTFIDSSWYFLRYTDPRNEKEFAAGEKLEQWMPVDLYSGGAEHTTMHLLYSRFWIKAMRQLKLVPWDEPYVRRMNRGIILGPDGQKMSKSHGNVVDPDEQVKRLGADTVRMYLAFIGPYAEVGAYPWSMDSIVGMRRFLDRVWNLGEKLRNYAITQLPHKGWEDEIEEQRFRRLANQTIKKVTDDIESFKFNTAIAQLMTFTNEISVLPDDNSDFPSLYALLLILLSPFAPHLAHELWERMGHRAPLSREPWPQYDPRELKSEEANIVVQVNGKKRGMVTVDAQAEEGMVVEMARQDAGIAKYLKVKKIEKTVYVKGKLLNIVTK